MNNDLQKNTDINGEPNNFGNKPTLSRQLKEFISTIIWAVVIISVVRCLLFAPFNIPSGSMIPTLLVGDYIFVSKYNYGYSKHSFFFSKPDFKGRIWYTPPQRGDVAVFRSTKAPFDYYVKRIIGLPNDTIQVKDSMLYINGEPVKRTLNKQYTYQEMAGSPSVLADMYTEYLPIKGGLKEHLIIQDANQHYEQSVTLYNGEINVNYTVPYHVPEGYFFAMGDNRDHSADSRFIDPDSSNYLGYVPIENLIGKVQFIFYSYDRQYPVWQFWHWPTEIRWDRLFKVVQ